tara:strand:+ start:746 stop:1339 length:594 start_codon:yes stop_codon:yes gene_type:complete
MFSEQTIRELQNMDITLSYNNDLSDKEKQDVHYMFETNMQRPGPRKKEQVFLDTLRGYLCELALDRCITNCTDNAPVTKGAEGLSYIQRKTDKIIDGMRVEVKSWNSSYMHAMPMTRAQANSIDSAIHMNDYFIMMSWTEIKKLRYQIKPHCLIKAKEIYKGWKVINWKYSNVGIDISQFTDYNDYIMLDKGVLNEV